MQLRRIGRYQLLEIVGKGGQGTVYRGHDPSTGQIVAVKILAEGHSDGDFLERFQREAEVGSQISHSAVIQTLSVGEASGTHFIAQELVPGGRTLDDHIVALRSQGEFEEDHYREVAEFFFKVVKGMASAHELDVVHRDIKPENILCINGKWKLADLGFVSRCGGKTYVGSLGYIAPEGPGRPSADVHGVGKILYEMVTGNEVVDFPECPSWIFDDESEASHFQELNTIILKAADPIAVQRQQCGWSLLGELESILPEGQQGSSVTVSPVTYDWGRYVYAALAFGLVMAVFNYVRLVDQALEEATTAPVQEIAGSK